MLKLEKLAFVLPITTRTNKWRPGLNLYGHFIQMASDLRRRWVTYPQKTHLNILSQADLCYKAKESVGRRFGIQEKK